MIEDPKIEPLNIGEMSEEDLEMAKKIMADDGNILIRYLRRRPTVGVKTVEKDGHPETLIKQRVICTGIPYGVLVGFQRDNKLHIGWSRRHSGVILAKDGLHKLLKETFDMLYEPQNHKLYDPENSDEAEKIFDTLMAVFSKKMMDFLAGESHKAIEPVAFAKKVGKLTAIQRGLRDTIHFNGSRTKTFPMGKHVVSAASGPVVKEVARGLQWFIPMVEKIYEGKAINVGYPELADAPEVPAESVDMTTELAIAENILPAVIHGEEGEKVA